MMSEILEYFKGDELAANVWQSKYQLKDNQGVGLEATPDDMHKRLAKEFARIEQNYQSQRLFPTPGEEGKLSNYGKSRVELNEYGIYQLFKDFKYIIPQGSIMSQLGADSIGSLSNCFVIGQPEDSYGGIFRKDEEMAQLMKRRGGVGIDISTLRPQGTSTSNAAKSSTGAVSFMHRFSNTTREVAQNGRRGALMISIDINHPDVMDFIKIKRDLSQVTGANISIKLNKEFMQAVENDEDYLLRFPCDVYSKIYKSVQLLPTLEYGILTSIPEVLSNGIAYVKKIKAREYWNEIIKSAHGVAEPGLMFWDNMVEYSPDGVYNQYRAITTNPCFRGDMKILTPYGYKTFESLENQECELINKDGDIVNGTVWCSGVKSIYKIITWNNKYIYCTLDHKFLTTENEEVEAKNLEGKRIMPYYFINSEINEYVRLGFLQGNGNLTRLKSDSHLGLEINIGENDKDIAELFEIQDNNRTIYIQGYNELLKQLKFSNATLPERTLPETFDEWNHKDKLMFFKGMYSANGSIISEYRISYKTTCKKLSLQIQNFLKIIGINSYITTNKEKLSTFSNGQYLCKESYDINISQFDSVKLFAEKIGFVHKYKKDSLEKLILEKAPKVRSVVFDSTNKVYDFNLQDDTHWGVVEGVIAHNCSEIGMQEHDACRLICVNLFSFVNNPFTSEATFDFEKFYQINYEAMRLSDDLVDLELEHIDRIIQKIKNDPESDDIKQVELDLWVNIKATAKASRRTGLGFTALGDTLAALGLSYDSDVSLAFTENIMRSKMRSELDCTIDLAIIRGTFDNWDASEEFLGDAEDGANNFYQFLCYEFPQQAKRMNQYGRRNVSWSTVAPTGTVSLMTQTTSGIEPLFMPFYMRRKKINPSDKDSRVDFTDQNGDSWQEFAVLHPKFRDWILSENGLKYIRVKGDNIEQILLDKESLQYYFENSPWYKSTANDIDWIKRVEMQSIIQRYISHSISSTINLPNDVSEEEVSKIYMESWKKGLKGITVYRDGCRSGVLVSTDEKKAEFDYHDAPKRPKSLKAKLHTISSKGKKFGVVVGFMNERPYELFAFENPPCDSTEGEVHKLKRSHYNFISPEYNIENLQMSAELAEEQLLCRWISMLLRHGARPEFVIDQVSKSPLPIDAFGKVVIRVLKKYIPDGTKSTITCSECGGTNVVFEEGCMSCKDCGNSKCG